MADEDKIVMVSPSEDDRESASRPGVSKGEDSFLMPIIDQDKLGESFLGGSTERTTITFSNLDLKLTTKTGTKQILDHISGTIHHSRLTALMGPSGSGKTSLLNVLAGRTKAMAGLSLSGDISMNNQAISSWSSYRRRCAYVEQDDLLFSNLTVYETIKLAAELRLPKEMTELERESRVESVLSELGLRKSRDTVVGNERIRGVSGGERKRVSIALEILRGPAVIFLDECTTGLDSFQALRVATTIKELALGGRTIVTSIHQPRSSIFALFDDIVVLSEGRVMYFGAASRMVQYFSELGHIMPENYNPADFVLDLVSVDQRSTTAEAATKKRMDDLNAHFLSRPEHALSDSDIDGSMPTDTSEVRPKYKYPTTFPRQFSLLLKRAVRQKFRDRIVMMIPLGGTIFFSLLLGFLYYRSGYNLTQEAIQDKVGCLFFLALNQFMTGMFSVITVFPREKFITNRERSAKAYRLSSYYFSRILADTPNLIFPVVMCVFVYFLVWFKMEAGAFFQTLFTMFLAYFVAVGLALCVGSLANSLQGAQQGVMPLMLIFVLFSGFYANNSIIPPELNWIQWISPIRWVFASLITIQFTGIVFECDDGPLNCVPSGEAYIARLGLQDDSFERSAGVLIAMVAFLICLAYTILRVKRVKWLVPNGVKN